MFKNINNLEDLKKEYRRLAKELHPDHGGSTQAFQEMLNQYDEALKRLLNSSTDDEIDNLEDLKETLKELLEIQDIIIELVGSWVWVSGETKVHKELLKSLHFRWSAKRLRWYLAPEGSKRRASKGSFQDICNRYGCEKLNGGSNTRSFKKALA